MQKKESVLRVIKETVRKHGVLSAVKAPALMSTRPVTAQDALDQCEKLSPMMHYSC